MSDRQRLLFSPTFATTSIESKQDFRPYLGKAQTRVFHVATTRFAGPATANEIAAETHRLFPDHSVESYRKRVREVERAGKLTQHERRKCRVSGKMCFTFSLR